MSDTANANATATAKREGVHAQWIVAGDGVTPLLQITRTGGDGFDRTLYLTEAESHTLREFLSLIPRMNAHVSIHDESAVR